MRKYQQSQKALKIKRLPRPCEIKYSSWSHIILRRIYLSFYSPISVISYFTGARNDRGGRLVRLSLCLSSFVIARSVATKQSLFPYGTEIATPLPLARARNDRGGGLVKLRLPRPCEIKYGSWSHIILRRIYLSFHTRSEG